MVSLIIKLCTFGLLGIKPCTFGSLKVELCAFRCWTHLELSPAPLGAGLTWNWIMCRWVLGSLRIKQWTLGCWANSKLNWAPLGARLTPLGDGLTWNETQNWSVNFWVVGLLLDQWIVFHWLGNLPLTNHNWLWWQVRKTFGKPLL